MRELDKRRESIWRSRWEMGEVGVERGDGWEFVGGLRMKDECIRSRVLDSLVNNVKVNALDRLEH